MQDLNPKSQTSQLSQKTNSSPKHVLSKDKKPARKKTQVYTSVWFERLVACIGLDATRKLLTAYGGKTLTLPRPLVFFQAQRNVMITKDFLSKKYKKVELEAKWGLSYATITKIIEETLADGRYDNWLE